MSLLFLKTVFWLLDEFYDFSCVVQLLYISDVYTIFIHSKVNFQVFLKMNITFYILKMITCIVRNKCILRMVIVIILLWNLELRLSELKFESNLHVNMLYLVMCFLNHCPPTSCLQNTQNTLCIIFKQYLTVQVVISVYLYNTSLIVGLYFLCF